MTIAHTTRSRGLLRGYPPSHGLTQFFGTSLGGHLASVELRRDATATAQAVHAMHGASRDQPAFPSLFRC